jgi:hypothetical protein
MVRNTGTDLEEVQAISVKPSDMRWVRRPRAHGVGCTIHLAKQRPLRCSHGTFRKEAIQLALASNPGPFILHRCRTWEGTQGFRSLRIASSGVFAVVSQLLDHPAR